MSVGSDMHIIMRLQHLPYLIIPHTPPSRKVLLSRLRKDQRRTNDGPLRPVFFFGADKDAGITVEQITRVWTTHY